MDKASKRRLEDKIFQLKLEAEAEYRQSISLSRPRQTPLTIDELKKYLEKSPVKPKLFVEIGNRRVAITGCQLAIYNDGDVVEHHINLLINPEEAEKWTYHKRKSF